MSKRTNAAARSAFTLIEALVSTSIMAIAGSALLLGVSSSLETSTAAVEQTIAAGMAQQFMDEIASKRYMAVGVSPYQWPLSPSAYELGGQDRERYDDIDDFHGYRSHPAADMWGIKLGHDDGEGDQRHSNFRATGYFNDWRQEVEVYYVSPTNLSVRLPAGATSDYRAVEVRILVEDPGGERRTLTTLRRVFAYVPG